MLKIEIDELFITREPPSSEALKKSLGKKEYSLYLTMLAEANEHTEPSEWLVKLGHKLADSNSLTFGFERLYRPLLCYALAAQSSGKDSLKACEAAMRLIDDFDLKEGISDSRISQLKSLFFQEAIQQHKQLLKLEEISDSQLRELFEQSQRLSPMPLAIRLDLHEAMYNRCNELLSQGNTSNPSQRIIDIQKHSLQFMEYVLNVEGIENIKPAMIDRAAKRQLDPEYIPNISPHYLKSSLSPYNKKNPSAFFWRRSTEMIIQVQQNKLLPLNEKSKVKDEYEKAIQLTPEERDNYRIIIKNGCFYQRTSTNEFQKKDTMQNVSHTGKDYAAYVINNRGEISLFNHIDDSGFFHSSPNNQAPVFFAGEMKIENGILKEITTHSGHYRPGLDNTIQALKHLKQQGINLNDVIVNILSVDENQQAYFKKYNAMDLIQHAQHAQEITIVANIEPASPTQTAEISTSSTHSSEATFADDDWADFSNFSSDESQETNTPKPK